MENKWESIIVFALSIPVLIIIIFLLNLFTFATAVFQAENADATVQVQLITIINSVAIAVLNVTYIILAMFILKKENNKYIEVNT